MSGVASGRAGTPTSDVGAGRGPTLTDEGGNSKLGRYRFPRPLDRVLITIIVR